MLHKGLCWLTSRFIFRLSHKAIFQSGSVMASLLLNLCSFASVLFLFILTFENHSETLLGLCSKIFLYVIKYVWIKFFVFFIKLMQYDCNLKLFITLLHYYDISLQMMLRDRHGQPCSVNVICDSDFISMLLLIHSVLIFLIWPALCIQYIR